MVPMHEPLGFLRAVLSTEDRTLYAYRPKRRTRRGIVWVSFALALVAGSVVFSLRTGTWTGWLLSIVPLLLASAAAFCGMLDLLNRPLFHLEVDRRARTLALMVPREQGQSLAKIRFGDVSAVEVKEKGPPPTWIVALVVSAERRMGLGACDRKEDADRVAAEFSTLLGVEILRIEYNGPS
jgi:hypothetical protein